MIELDAAARPSCRKLDDFIRKLFPNMKILSFCGQMPFRVRFKHHCTRQRLDGVLSRTVRTYPFSGMECDFLALSPTARGGLSLTLSVTARGKSSLCL